MTVQALYDYQGTPADTVDKFHGNQLVYVCWEQHLMFCAPHCLPLPPDMPFGALVKEVLPGVYDSHPEWPQIDWDQVVWQIDDQIVKPDMEAAIKDMGVGHKSVIRFRTPGLNGIGGVAT